MFFGQEFQSHEAVEFNVLGLVHDTHAAAAELLDNAVVRDGLPDERVGLCHRAVILGCDCRRVNESA
jgi:hypothetical protein